MDSKDSCREDSGAKRQVVESPSLWGKVHCGYRKRSSGGVGVKEEFIARILRKGRAVSAKRMLGVDNVRGVFFMGSIFTSWGLEF